MFHGLSTIDISNFFELDTYGRTRGHFLKLKKGRVSTDLLQHFFTESERVIIIWNSLADNVVQSQSLNSFKSSLQREYNSITLHNIADVMGVSEVLLCPYRCLEYGIRYDTIR